MNESKRRNPNVFFGLMMVIVFLFTITGSATAQDIPTDMSTTQTDAPQTSSIEVISPYFSIEHQTMADGTEVSGYIINGPPEPLAEFAAERAASIMPLPSRGTLASFPSYDWVFGCSAVSGAMIAAYYDNNGYPNMYAGPTNGGVMPLTDTSWSTWVDGASKTYPNNPLIASHNGVDGRVTKGSIDDYWVSYGSTANDPYITGAWTQHAWSNAIGDYMWTSQSAFGNSDGSTTFWNYTSSADRYTCVALEGNGRKDGTLGRKHFYEARGYSVGDCYNQKTDNTIAGGFSLANFQAEIDAGHPVLLNLQGHSIVGYGYSGSTIYIRDTWDNNPANTYTMSWGGSYEDMNLLSVSVVHLNPIGQYHAYLPLVVNGNQAVPKLLWGQSISGSNSSAYANQDFDSIYNEFDIYLADDFQVGGGGWNVKEIFVPGYVWNGGTTLLNANQLVFEIYTNSGGKPAGQPGVGSPLVHISLAPTDGQITLSSSVTDNLGDVTLALSSPVNLPPGTYWLVFYPQLELAVGGQYGRYVSDTTNGFDAMVINPGNGFFSIGDWTSIQDSSTFSVSQQDLAFEIWGYD